MMYALVLFITTYCIIMLILTFAWNSIKPSSYFSKSSKTPFITVIIPIRNEASSISKTINSILNNDFEKNNYEIIIVNDHSTDTSTSIVEQIMNQEKNVKLINLNKDLEGKKQAISLAISQSKGEVILCTDGDCEVQKGWISSYAQSYKNNKSIKLVFGAVSFTAQNHIQKLLQLELAGLVGIGGATSALGFPSMINGANFSYRKEVFEEVNGYVGNEQIPSGDDEFLLRKISKKYPKGIRFLKEQKAIVVTSPPSTIQELINQRKRWAGKWKSHKDLLSLSMPTFIFILNALILYGIYKLLFSFEIGLSILLLKLIFDYVFMSNILSFYKSKLNLTTFISLEIIYPFYVIFFGIASNFGSYTWKERQFNTYK